MGNRFGRCAAEAAHLAALSLLVFLATAGFRLSIPFRGMPTDLAVLIGRVYPVAMLLLVIDALRLSPGARAGSTVLAVASILECHE